jgi:hypothetical protein
VSVATVIQVRLVAVVHAEVVQVAKEYDLVPQMETPASVSA